MNHWAAFQCAIRLGSSSLVRFFLYCDWRSTRIIFCRLVCWTCTSLAMDWRHLGAARIRYRGRKQRRFSGGSVAISSDGNIIAIGASGNDGANGDASGHVWVWEWSGTDWDQKGGDIDGEAEGDGSGSSVALSSDGLIVAVGASRNDVFGYDTGHVRVWEWSGTDWVQEGEDIDGEARGDYSGGAVALSSNGFDCRHWSQVQWRKWRTFRQCSYLGMVW